MQSLRFHLSVLDGDVNAVRECIDNGMDPLLKDQVRRCTVLVSLFRAGATSPDTARFVSTFR